MRKRLIYLIFILFSVVLIILAGGSFPQVKSERSYTFNFLIEELNTIEEGEGRYPLTIECKTEKFSQRFTGTLETKEKIIRYLTLLRESKGSEKGGRNKINCLVKTAAGEKWEFFYELDSPTYNHPLSILLTLLREEEKRIKVENFPQ